MRKLIEYLRPFFGRMSWGLFIKFCGTITDLMIPWILSYIIDDIIPLESVRLIFYVLSSILAYILSLLMLKLSQRMVYALRKKVFERLSELPVSYFDRKQTGDIISRITYDIDTINTSLANDLVQILTSIITVIGSLVMMLIISPVLVLVFAVTIPISVLLTKYMTGKFRPLFRKRSAKLGELNGYVEEKMSGQKTVKAYNQEKTIIDDFDEKNHETVTAYYNADYYGSMVGPSVNFINNISLSLVSVFGALLYLFSRLALGDVAAFVLYSRKFSGPINEMANIISDFQSTLAAAERVFKLIDEEAEPEDVPNATVFTDVKGEVDIEKLEFSYVPGKIVLHDFNLEVPRGNLIAIVGPTGAGKTTLINLLMRFYDPNSGTIRLDGVDISHANRKSLRLAYAMVLQDTWLFQGTIYENLAYGNENASPEQVVEAAKAAKIHKFIKQLPQGYDTVLSEDGLNISQGQKQLLTIARAMLANAKMLILDEATSNVDTRTEIQIQGAMRALMKDKTCFVIAHRLSTIKNADTILVVDKGNIVEQGSHEKLMEKKGLYSKLYYSQFEAG